MLGQPGPEDPFPQQLSLPNINGLQLGKDELFFYPDQKSLLEQFIAWFKEADPDIIIGWNVAGFDLRFLERKCREFKVDFDLSRSGRNVLIREREYGGGYAAHISGRVALDGPELLRGAYYSFEDFTLETVAQTLLGKGKIIASEEEKIAEIERLFQNDKTGLAQYNLQDCLLVTEIFRKSGLLELWVRRSQITGLLLNEVGRSVAAFDHAYLPRLHRKGYVAPNVEDVHLLEHAAGGYVMEPAPGIYDDVVVLDFKSLYPSIIRSFKIEPLSLLEKDQNPLFTPLIRSEKKLRRYQFSNTAHILPELIERLMAQREIAKQNHDAFLSHAIKILMNSFYGVMGTSGCRFYHPDLPSAITGTGQWLLKESRKYFESLGCQVLYGDTDSIFVKLKPGEAADAEAIGKQLAGLLNEYWRERLKKMGVVSHLEMEYEKYYRKLVLPRARVKEGGGAMKRYAGITVKNGREKLEFVGMEYVRSDWTPLAKEFQFDLYWKVLHGEDVKPWLNNLIKRIMNGEMDEKLIYRKRLRKDAGDYTKNIPPQVQAALILQETFNKKTRNIRYLITRDGPQPVEQRPHNIDYRHYIEKQLQPIADSILNLTGLSFKLLIQPAQLSLFDSPGNEG
jgi:DNA polymerase-2